LFVLFIYGVCICVFDLGGLGYVAVTGLINTVTVLRVSQRTRNYLILKQLLEFKKKNVQAVSGLSSCVANLVTLFLVSLLPY
jgi:hypothetical protein